MGGKTKTAAIKKANKASTKKNNVRKLLVETPNNPADAKKPGKPCLDVAGKKVKNVEHNKCKGTNITKSTATNLTGTTTEKLSAYQTKHVVPREGIPKRGVFSKVDVKRKAGSDQNEAVPSAMRKIDKLSKKCEPTKIPAPHPASMGDNNANNKMHKKDGYESLNTNLIASAKIQLKDLKDCGEGNLIPTYAPPKTYNVIHQPATYANVLKTQPFKIGVKPSPPALPTVTPSARPAQRKWRLTELKDLNPKTIEHDEPNTSRPWSVDRTVKKPPESLQRPESCAKEVENWREHDYNPNYADDDDIPMPKGKASFNTRPRGGSKLIYALANDEYYLKDPPPENGVEYIHEKVYNYGCVEYLLSFQSASGSYWLDEAFVKEQCPRLLSLFEAFEQRREALLRKFGERRINGLGSAR